MSQGMAGVFHQEPASIPVDGDQRRHGVRVGGKERLVKTGFMPKLIEDGLEEQPPLVGIKREDR